MKLSSMLILFSLVYSTLCIPELVRRNYRFRRSSHYPRALSATYAASGDYLSPHQLQSSGRNDTNARSLDGGWLTNFSNMPPPEPVNGITGKRGKPITQILKRRYPKRSGNTGSKSRSTHHGSVDASPRFVSGIGSTKHLDMAAHSKDSIKPDKVKQALNTAPTPQPTTPGSALTTVHINDEDDFALLLPKNPNGMSLWQLFHT